MGIPSACKHLICDLPTRWNVTLAMLQWLHKHQRAIKKYLYEYDMKKGWGELGLFSICQWLLIQDAVYRTLYCLCLRGQQVSHETLCINDTVLFVFLL